MSPLTLTVHVLLSLWWLPPQPPAIEAFQRPGPVAQERLPSPPASSRRAPTQGVWPLLPVPDVLEGFDPPESDYGSGHRGVDLAGSVGQPVRSALPGRVTFASTLAGRGVVVVDHGTTRTTYEPVGALRSVGDQVAAGDRIGLLQYPGSHCRPRACLHWGWINRSDDYLDPLDLVGAGPVVLLPLS